MREDITEEDINIDPKLINDTYQRLLKNGKLIFLEDLKNMAISDHELESEASSISRAFDMMKNSIGTSGSKIENMTLDDWRRHGLKRDVVERIGYLAHYYDTLSPKGRRKIQKQFSSATKSSEDNYEDDFEDLDEDESISTLRNNFMDGSQNNSSIRTGSECGSHNYRYDSKIDDEELTVDSKIKTKAIAMTYSYDHDEVYSDIEDYAEDSVKERMSAPAITRESPPNKQKLLRPTPSPELNKRPQTMATVPMKPTTQVHRLPVEKLAEPRRVQTADNSTNKNAAVSSSGSGDARRHSASTSASAAVSTARGRTAGWITNGEWKLGEKIGSGSFGDVFQCLNHKGKLFAVKRMSMIDKSSEVDNLLQEIQLMRGFSHIHIVAYLGAWVDPDECFLYIFQEWVPGGSVAHMLKNFGAFNLSVVRQYTRQILLGLQYLHNNGIIHRDIKGGNILVDDSGTVKLADFGASTQLNHFNKTQETSTIKGTPYFMAPEVLANSRYGRKGDIWAVGCTMIQMLTGEPPWKDKNLKGLVQLHMLLTSWEGPPEYNVPVTPVARECLEMCFQKKEADRPSAQELLDCEFLRDDDEMDESFALPSNHDPFEDSGILSGLKQEMNRAVTRSAQGLAKNRLNNDDTIAGIENQIHERQARQGAGGRQKLPVNPYSSKASAVNPFKSPPVTPANIDLPPSQFVTSPPGPYNAGFSKPSTPPTLSTQIDVNTPVRDGPRPPNTYSNGRPSASVAGSGSLVSASNPNTPVSRGSIGNGKDIQDIAIPVSQSMVGKSTNPFTRGNTSLKQSVAQAEQVQLHPSGAITAREKHSGSSSRLHMLMNMSVDNQHQGQQPLQHHGSSHHNAAPQYPSHRPIPHHVGSSNQEVSNGAHKFVNNVVKESLTSIKKKAAESKSSRNTPREYNLSSARDEEITPYNDNASDADDDAAEYDDGGDTYGGGHFESKSDSSKHYSSKYKKPANYVMRREDSIDIIEEKVDLVNYPAGPRTHSAGGTRSDSKAADNEYDDDSEPELLVCSPSKVPVHSSGLNLHGITPTPTSAGPDSGRRGSNSSVPGVGGGVPVNKPLSAKNRSKLPPAVDPQFSRLPSNPHSNEVTPRSARINSPSGPAVGITDDYQTNSHSGDSADNWICLSCRSTNVSVSNWCVVCAIRRGADGKKGVSSVVKRV